MIFVYNLELARSLRWAYVMQLAAERYKDKLVSRGHCPVHLVVNCGCELADFNPGLSSPASQRAKAKMREYCRERGLVVPGG